MNVGMIVTDLDNTLLRNDKTISDYTVSVLDKCRAKGLKTVYATARSLPAVSKFFDIFTPDVFIGYGGSLAVYNGKIILRHDIPADTSFQLISECLNEPAVSTIHAINESAAHTNRPDPADLSMSHYRYIDLTKNNNISYLKITVTSMYPDIVERIAGKFPTLDMLRYTGENMYRFANRNAVKWNAVRGVAEYFNIDTASVVAFGDDTNDLEMLMNCGVGIAVANAIGEVKASADYISESNENDGVAKWLESHIL